ncbi:MAG: glycoside hydrolase [Gallionellales bacterium 35-53-114]|jgi:alpha-amylase/alpha-mannosidase (GH57 family)|nr:MAG: glycoside hydrolase [Gallionellales bacterium 35-53-114]OYZ65204.1 MAG: glycoside hydrolase [Gallionellales bacterium 24-53-125]OZB08110.1 MAG: glycoside hydrolase [Gallionellales bacterium 39-52-133]HQS58031.1 glycoside hydrolase family 57 protein [Gallionellaceae bacterium]HQS73587.1 glycoside hydrolase family 57 protein [Gallionellaceae bacterium]
MTKSVDLVFLWHMHQPDYRDYASGDFLLPWVYLHAIKDYSDMAYHLEQHPQVKVVVNFVPVLLDQLEDYQQQFATGNIRDPLLRLLARKDLSNVSADERDLIIDSCFRSDHNKMVAPYPFYKRLSDIFKLLEPGGPVALSYLSGQYLADLLTWYHLAWCGESLRREHDLLISLMSKDENFTYEDRKALFDLMGSTISGIIPRYRKLEERGQIEVSTTPHYHPLAPLLLDLHSGRESQPDSSLPQSQNYPGGRARVQAQLQHAIESHQKRFGIRPQGVWPAEGAVSTELIGVLAEQNCRWAASGEAVLVNSLNHKNLPVPVNKKYLYWPYRLQGTANTVRCFFRDDRLADMIGFEYANWNGKDAALHFVAQLEAIAENAEYGETPVVSVILDGENAWEYYPYNGYHFLNDLYSALEARPQINTTTYRDYLDELESGNDPGKVKEGELPGLVAGSWVYGTFSTWIGSPDKNHAWDLLCAAKLMYDMVIAAGRLSEEEQRAAERQLSSCESSDWFWWFGDYNPSHAVASFDRLYRHNLMHLYQLLKLEIPENLNLPISQGGGSAEAGGTMRRGS